MPAASEDNAHDLVSGQVVAARYEIDGPIGEGGMGVVYLAHDRSLGSERRVALKILASRYVGRPAREKRFANEARYAGRLPMHTNLATTLDAGRIEDGRPYIAMEYVDGPAINGLSVVTGRTIPTVELCRLARGVADALRVVHESGLVHRDLTPTNVLVTTLGGEWVPKLIDFSHAASIDGPRLELGHPRRLTQPHETPGTPGYMPPEQVTNAYPSPSMDVFAFGVLLWELFAERHAYRQRDRAAYFDEQKREPHAPPPLETHRPGLPPAIYKLIDDCTRLDPAQRPRAQEIVRRLDALVWGLTEARSGVGRGGPSAKSAPSTKSAPSARASVVSVVPPAPILTERSEDLEPDGQPRRVLLLAGVFIVVLAVVGALAWLWLQRDERPHAGSSADVSTREAPAAEHPTRAEIPAEDPEPTPVTTAAPEPEPAPDPALGEPSPDDPADPPVEDDAEPTVDEPTPSEPPKARAPKRSVAAVRDSAECVTLRASADAAIGRIDWSELLRLTDQSRCWTPKARARIRARALSELGRHQACVREHGKSRDPVVIDIVKTCKESL